MKVPLRSLVVITFCGLLLAPSMASTTPDTATTVSKGGGEEARPSIKRKKKTSKLPEIHQLIGRRWMFLMPVEVAFSAGALDGFRLLDESGAFVHAEMGLTPGLRYKRGKVLLRAPLSVSQRQGIDHDVRWTDFGVGLSLDARWSRSLDLGARTRLTLKHRPGWPDPYKPEIDAQGLPTGDLLATNRNSHTRLEAGAFARWELKEVTITGGVDFDRWIHTQDTEFDPVLRPGHLTPDDRDVIGGRLGVKGEVERWRWKWSLGAKAEHIAYAFEFARDAGTGLTHAAPGGEPANPLQSFVRLGLGHRSSFWLKELKTRLVLNLDLDHNLDLFEGYKTWTAFGVGPTVRVRPAPRWKAEFGARWTWRLYTKEGYQPSERHPPLDAGDDIRALNTAQVEAELSHTLKSRWLTLFFALRARQTDNNFPNYTPFSNPPGAVLDIDFDTSSLLSEVGARANF